MTNEDRLWYDDVPAPVDADGNVVPLTTTVMYDESGKECLVSGSCSFTYNSEDGWWGVNFVLNGGGVVSDFRLERPDSLEKLSDDLGRYADDVSSCSYFGMENSQTCDGCPAYGHWKNCASTVLKDVAHRVAALKERDAKEAN